MATNTGQNYHKRHSAILFCENLKKRVILWDTFKVFAMLRPAKQIKQTIISTGVLTYTVLVAQSALVDIEDKDKIISMYVSPSCYISKIEIKNSCTVAISSGYKYWTNYHKRHSVSLFCKNLKKRVILWGMLDIFTIIRQTKQIKLTIVSSGALVCPVLVALSIVVDMVDQDKIISIYVSVLCYVYKIKIKK